jgi:NADPH:quinone reductase-like Zn-dependent oxidoreductase
VKAARSREFGGPDAIEIEEVPKLRPGEGQVLVRVKAAGVGPWDALIRERKSVPSLPLPLTLGSDIAGVVGEAGSRVAEFKAGDEIYGVTNEQFIGGYAEQARASANMIARKPQSLDYVEAASAQVVAVTAWQMLFDYAQARAGQTALITGAAGNVGRMQCSSRKTRDCV